MIDQVRVLGILPARKGSKGVPGKNTRSLLGKPLIKWAADALASSKVITKKICSTDDENIAQTDIMITFRSESMYSENNFKYLIF